MRGLIAVGLMFLMLVGCSKPYLEEGHGKEGHNGMFEFTVDKKTGVTTAHPKDLHFDVVWRQYASSWFNSQPTAHGYKECTGMYTSEQMAAIRQVVPQNVPVSWYYGCKDIVAPQVVADQPRFGMISGPLSAVAIGGGLAAIGWGLSNMGGDNFTQNGYAYGGAGGNSNNSFKFIKPNMHGHYWNRSY